MRAARGNAMMRFDRARRAAVCACVGLSQLANAVEAGVLQHLPEPPTAAQNAALEWQLTGAAVPLILAPHAFGTGVLIDRDLVLTAGDVVAGVCPEQLQVLFEPPAGFFSDAAQCGDLLSVRQIAVETLPSGRLALLKLVRSDAAPTPCHPLSAHRGALPPRMPVYLIGHGHDAQRRHVSQGALLYGVSDGLAALHGGVQREVVPGAAAFDENGCLVGIATNCGAEMLAGEQLWRRVRALGATVRGCGVNLPRRADDLGGAGSTDDALAPFAAGADLPNWSPAGPAAASESPRKTRFAAPTPRFGPASIGSTSSSAGLGQAAIPPDRGIIPFPDSPRDSSVDTTPRAASGGPVDLSPVAGVGVAQGASPGSGPPRLGDMPPIVADGLGPLDGVESIPPTVPEPMAACLWFATLLILARNGRCGLT